VWWDDGRADTEGGGTFQVVSRLNSRFLQELGSDSRFEEVGPDSRGRARAANVTYGVGSTAGRTRNGRVPMLLIDEAFAPSHFFRPRLSRRRDDWLHMGRRDRPLIRFEEVDDDLKKLFKSWDVPDETEVLFTRPPVATSARPGTQVWAGDHDATVGFAIDVAGQPLMLSTAGHLAGNALPVAINVRRTGWFGRLESERIGAVSISNDPVDGTPGADVAVINPREAFTPPITPRSHPVDPLDVDELKKVTIRDAQSGIRTGWVLGAMQSARPLGPRIWKNCWTISEYRGGIVQQGDSGGPAILDCCPDGGLLGHVVAALGIERWQGRRQIALVQDIHTILEFLENSYGAPVRVSVGRGF
jgi:hypothetical protein